MPHIAKRLYSEVISHSLTYLFIRKKGYGLSQPYPFCRAEDGTQTRDPQLGRLMLYQLSYFRNFRWAKMDSNHRRHKPADLQSAPFGHSGICPIAFEFHRFITFVSQLRCKDTTIFVNSKRNLPFLLHKLHIHHLYYPIYPLHALLLAPWCWL